MICSITVVLVVLTVFTTGFMSNAYSDSIAMKAKLKQGPFESNLYFPDNNTIIAFNSKNKICPDDNCKHEFTNGTFNPSASGQDERYLSGTLKMEDKSKSTANFTSYKYYKLGGVMTHTPAGSEGNSKMDEKITNYRGNLGIDPEDPIFYPDFKYDSTITYGETSHAFNLTGISK
jgi:hypothetical protein